MFARGIKHVAPTERFDDFDFVCHDGAGRLLGLVEVKVRRSPLARYGDVLLPERKWREAQLTLEEGDGAFAVAVTAYGCGALVEVNLAQRPSEFRPIQRRDRRDRPAVPHVIYRGDQLVVLERGRS